MHEYAAEVGMPEIHKEVRFYIYRDVAELAPVFEAVTGMNPRVHRKSWYEGDARVAEQGDESIFLTTTGYSADDLVTIAAHELSHAQASAIAGFYGDGATSRVSSDGPVWVREGIATLHESFILDRSGVESFVDIRSRITGWVRDGDYAPLRSLETWEQNWDYPHSHYNLFMLAAELLASQAGEKALFDYFILLQPGTTWKAAFDSAFGMTVEEFYVLFEEHRAAGFPEVDIPASTLMVRWHIGEGVPKEEVDIAKAGARAMREYLVSLGFTYVSGELPYFIHQDGKAMAVEYANRTGKSLQGSLEAWTGENPTTARANPAGIFLLSGNPKYIPNSPERKMKITAHEIFHGYQNAVCGLRNSSPEHLVPEAGPRWFREGAAEYGAYRSLDKAGILSFDDLRPGFVKRGKAVDASLSSMEHQKGFRAVRGLQYTYSLLAAELLASYAGEAKLLGYCHAAQPGTTWQEAFERTFGMTVEEFYKRFEEHRIAGFPDLDIPPPYLRLTIGDNVSEEDRQAAIEGVQLMHEYMVSLNLPKPRDDIDFYLYHDMEHLIAQTMRVAGWSEEDARNYWKKAHGTVGQGWTIVNTSSPPGYDSQKLHILKLSAGEFLAAMNLARSGLRPGPGGDVVPGIGPPWMTQGIPTFFILRALAEVGLVSYDEERNRSDWFGFVWNGKRADKSLSEMETWTSYHMVMGNAGRYSALAIELLANFAGEGALVRYYDSLTPGTTWKEGFQRTFGMPVKEFYELFEDYRDAGFPAVETPKSAY